MTVCKQMNIKLELQLENIWLLKLDSQENYVIGASYSVMEIY